MTTASAGLAVDRPSPRSTWSDGPIWRSRSDRTLNDSESQCQRFASAAPQLSLSAIGAALLLTAMLAGATQWHTRRAQAIAVCGSVHSTTLAGGAERGAAGLDHVLVRNPATDTATLVAIHPAGPPTVTDITVPSSPATDTWVVDSPMHGNTVSAAGDLYAERFSGREPTSRATSSRPSPIPRETCCSAPRPSSTSRRESPSR